MTKVFLLAVYSDYYPPLVTNSTHTKKGLNELHTNFQTT